MGFCVIRTAAYSKVAVQTKEDTDTQLQRVNCIPDDLVVGMILRYILQSKGFQIMTNKGTG